MAKVGTSFIAIDQRNGVELMVLRVDDEICATISRRGMRPRQDQIFRLSLTEARALAHSIRGMTELQSEEVD